METEPLAVYYAGPNMKRGLEEHFRQTGKKTIEVRERPSLGGRILPPIYCPGCGSTDLFRAQPPDSPSGEIEAGLRPYVTIRALVHVDEDGRLHFEEIDGGGKFDFLKMVETLNDLNYIGPEWFECRRCGYEALDIHDFSSCALEICEYTGDYHLRTDEPTNCCPKCGGEKPECTYCDGAGKGDKVEREALIKFCTEECYCSNQWSGELKELIHMEGRRLDLNVHPAGICEGCMHTVDMYLFDICIPEILKRRGDEIDGISPESEEDLRQGIIFRD